MHSDLQSEFRILLNVQQFFSLVNLGDIKLLNELGSELFRLEKWFSEDKLLTIDVEDMQEILARVRFELESFDKNLPAATLRRYFEQSSLVTKDILENLLKFYLRKKNKTVADRDKVDLIVTRWGRQTNNQEGILSRSPDLLTKLNEIYKNLSLPLNVIDGEFAAINALQKERIALVNIKSLRELIDRQVLLRVRKIKDEMEIIFFQPNVLTELVEVNISLHNIFQKLLAAEQPRINPNNEIKNQALKDVQLTDNSNTVSRESKEVLDESLLSTLEEIGHALSTLTLKVQMLTDKLRTQRNKNEDQIIL
jgi:hypothetical protein